MTLYIVSRRGDQILDYSFLGKRIREERLRAHLTQDKLAEDVHISTAYLGQIERGERNVTLDKLLALAGRLGVTIDFLLSDYIQQDDDRTLDSIAQLLQGRTAAEKEMAANVLKLLFSYTDKKI